jgi:hypothetical protein
MQLSTPVNPFHLSDPLGIDSNVKNIESFDERTVSWNL